MIIKLICYRYKFSISMWSNNCNIKNCIKINKNFKSNCD